MHESTLSVIRGRTVRSKYKVSLFSPTSITVFSWPICLPTSCFAEVWCELTRAGRDIDWSAPCHRASRLIDYNENQLLLPMSGVWVGYGLGGGACIIHTIFPIPLPWYVCPVSPHPPLCARKRDRWLLARVSLAPQKSPVWIGLRKIRLYNTNKKFT